MTRTVLRSVVVAGVVAGLTAACGTPSAGSAATVGGRRISIQDVQNATEDLQALLGPTQPVPQSIVLYLLAAAPYIQKNAAQLGVGVSLDDARAEFVQNKVPHPSSAAVQVIQANEIVGRVKQADSQAGNALLAQVSLDLHRDGMTANPRYGSFDYTHGRIAPDVPDWLPASSAAASASPSPAPAAP